MISVISAPANVAPVKNPVALKLETDNYVTTPGVKAQVVLTFTNGEAVADETIRFEWEGNDITFTCKAAPDQSGLQFPDNAAGDFTDDWAENYFIRKGLYANHAFFKAFEIKLTGGSQTSAVVTITAREAGTDFSLTVTNGISDCAVTTNTAGVDEIARENFRILCGLMVEDDNGNYVQAIETEADPVNNFAAFRLEDILRSYVSPYLPDYNAAAIAKAEKVLKKYWYWYGEYYGDPAQEYALANNEGSKKRILLAGLPEDKFPGNDFLNEYTVGIANEVKFLTNQPRLKEVPLIQQEYLYIYNPSLTQINLKVKAFYSDGTDQEATVLTVAAPEDHRVYCLPAGFSQLNVANINVNKTVVKYQVYVAWNSGLESEKFTYKLNNRYMPNSNYLLFLNRLGGFDTVWCTGHVRIMQNPTAGTAERQLPYDYSLRDGEMITYNERYMLGLEIALGYKDKEYISYLRELWNSSHVYLVQSDHFLRVNAERSERELENTEADQVPQVIRITPSFNFAA